MTQKLDNEGYQFLVDLKRSYKSKIDFAGLEFNSDGILTLNDKKYDTKLKTAFKIGSANVNPSAMEDTPCYTVGDIIFFLKKQNEKRGTYLKLCKENNLKNIKQIDRKVLLNLLKGSLSFKIDNILSTKDDLASNKVSGNDKTNKMPKAGKRAKNDKRKRKRDPTQPNNELELVKYWKKKQQPLSTLNSILQGNVDFGKIFETTINFIKSKSVEELKTISTASIHQKNKKNKTSRNTIYPIIIVPALATSTINISTVTEFLESGKLSLLEDRSKATVIADGEKSHITHGNRLYRIESNINKIKPEDYDKITAVFLNGKKWQFKNWPQELKQPSESEVKHNKHVNNRNKKDGEKEIATIFARILGIYVYFDDTKVNKDIKDWNILKIKLKRQRRNLDQIQSHRIWEAITNFISSKKQHLL